MNNLAFRVICFGMLGLAALLGACSADQGVAGSATGSTCPSDSSLTYANFGQAFLASNCLSCHAGKERPSLTSQAAVQAAIDEIDRVAASGPNATNTAMPEGAQVAVADRQKLGEWLACGAP